MANLNHTQRQKIKEQLRIKRELEASQKLKHDQGITDQESANDDKPKSLKDIKKMVADQKKMQGKTNTTLTQKDQLKKIKKIAKNTPKENISKKVNWSVLPGDLVRIPSHTRVRPSVNENLDEDSFGIVIKMTESNNGEHIRDSQSLVFCPSGRQWYYTKSLKKA